MLRAGRAREKARTERARREGAGTGAGTAQTVRARVVERRRRPAPLRGDTAPPKAIILTPQARPLDSELLLLAQRRSGLAAIEAVLAFREDLLDWHN